MRSRRSAILVIGFVVVDLIVIALAYVLTHREDEPPTGITPVATDDGIDRNPPLQGPLVLAASPDGALVRLTRGSCDSRDRIAPRVWLAASFKAPLTEVRVPALQEALGIEMTDTVVTIVGALKDCTVMSFSSTDDGATWTQTTPTAGTWYLGTDTTTSAINGPVRGGSLNLDCTPTSVVTLPSDGAGLVTCAGYNVLEVRPSVGEAPDGVTTVALTQPAGVTRTGAGSLLVLASTDTCTDSLIEVSTEQGAQPRQVACFDDADTDSAPLGLAASGERVFAQIGYRLLVSGNAGRNFATYPGQADGGVTASTTPSP